jgi:hypothetical protein
MGEKAWMRDIWRNVLESCKRRGVGRCTALFVLEVVWMGRGYFGRILTLDGLRLVTGCP